MSKLADLHIHTHYSDGTDSPEEIVEQAMQCGLNSIAIADHDTVDAIEPAIKAASKCDLEIIPAIELSTELNGKDIHMLGYLFDYHNTQLKEVLIASQDYRVERMAKMIEKLKILGIDNITLDEVCTLAKSKSVGRPHLAKVLVEKGWVADHREAFDKYLAEGAPAYVTKFKQTPTQAVELIQKAGGIAVLAHPMISQVDEIIPGLVEAGLGGLEVYYPHCPQQIIHFYEGLASKYNLLMTGGSDAHGKAKKHTYVGKVKVPYELVEKMKEAVGGKQA